MADRMSVSSFGYSTSFNERVVHQRELADLQGSHPSQNHLTTIYSEHGIMGRTRQPRRHRRGEPSPPNEASMLISDDTEQHVVAQLHSSHDQAQMNAGLAPLRQRPGLLPDSFKFPTTDVGPQATHANQTTNHSTEADTSTKQTRETSYGQAG
jgi:hypothetical protein